MKLIYNLQSIRPTLTGVNYYTWHMVATLLVFYPEIEVIGIRSGKLLKGRTLRLFMREVIQVNKGALSLYDCRSKYLRKRGYLIRQLIKHLRGRPKSFFLRLIFMQMKRLARSSFTKLLLSVLTPPIKLLRKLVSKLKALTITQLSYRLFIKQLNQIAVNRLNSQYIYHELNFTVLNHKGPKITTIHDVSNFTHPEFHPKAKGAHMQAQIKKSTRLADGFVVSCEHSKNELIRLFPYTQNKIHIIPPAASPDFRVRSKTEVRRTLDKFKLNYQGYMLCVATLEPRKNMVRLIKAYAKLPQSLRQTYPLVLAGAKGWMYKHLMKAIKSKTVVDSIIMTGYLPRSTLCDLFSGAKLMAYPSIYEGFGSPVLEAMYSGTPVLTSNTSSMPEVAGGAAVLVDPLDIDSIKQGLLDILSNQPHCDQLIQKGLERAKAFTWEKTVERHIEEVYSKFT